jgi:3-methyl-2-oxobutanoate hydroxymethyltransferase
MNNPAPKKIRTSTLAALKKQGRPFAVMTAYDYPGARALDEAGIEVALVGDSLGMVVLGEESTLAVSMDAMVHHCRAAVRGAGSALVVADMPFMSYQAGIADALRNAGRLVKEGGAHAVKLEGGAAVVQTVAALREAGIAVMGHIGLTPQSVHALGGYRLQGKAAAQAAQILKDAKALEKAGAFAVVLEVVPAALAKRISKALAIPTIGIGAGVGCDGQVLVMHDALGMSPEGAPRHARQYDNLYGRMVQGLKAYRDDVLSGKFPGDGETPA